MFSRPNRDNTQLVFKPELSPIPRFEIDGGKRGTFLQSAAPFVDNCKLQMYQIRFFLLKSFSYGLRLGNGTALCNVSIRNQFQFN